MRGKVESQTVEIFEKDALLKDTEEDSTKMQADL